MGKEWRAVGAVSLLSAWALGVQGYHPYAEDGGLYVAGVERLLDPALFAVRPEFVEAPMRFSLFAPAVAAVVRGTHLPLEWALLGLYVGSVWLTLWAGWMLIARCVAGFAGRIGGVALLACWLTMPIAGTSLMLMDPYVTARSFSTPLVMLALAWGRDRRWGRCGGALVVAGCLHPLMAGYGAALVVMMAVRRLEPTHRKVRDEWGTVWVGGVALAGAAVVQALAPGESPEYVRVAMTRYYWFPFAWRWFEWVGLVAPLGVVWWLGRRTALGRAAAGLGCVALAVAMVFARAGLAAHLVARMQPLRCFQMVYVVMILLLGAWVAERWLRDRVWRWAAMLVALGGSMGWMQVRTFAASNHFEAPWIAPENRWEQAFVWVRGHTPKDALFALDARYITEGKGEDAQGFRAIAERSVLADYSKDGGEAAIAPALVGAWVEGQTVQTDLERASDAERLARLRPLGVGWVVLEVGSVTRWECGYANEVVKVCRTP